MGLFLSTIFNRIDSKGRVSIPGPFRAVIAQTGGQAVVLVKSPIHAALDGFAPTVMDDINLRLEKFPMFSSDQDDLAAAIMAESVSLAFDSEGRIVLPEELIAHAGLKDKVAFAGLGSKFQMWTPDAWEERRIAARNAIKTKGLVLPAKGGS